MSKLRLVNLTESIWPKRGLNMTDTDKPYLLEHDQKMTKTNVNLLSLTESDWIWQKEKNIHLTTTTKITDWSWPNNFFLIFPQRRKYMVFSIFGHIHTIILVVVGIIYGILNFWSYSHDHFSRCENFSVKFIKSFFVVVSFRSCSNFSVKFIRSNWIGQVNNPLKIGN